MKLDYLEANRDKSKLVVGLRESDEQPSKPDLEKIMLALYPARKRLKRKVRGGCNSGNRVRMTMDNQILGLIIAGIALFCSLVVYLYKTMQKVSELEHTKEIIDVKLVELNQNTTHQKRFKTLN